VGSEIDAGYSVEWTGCAADDGKGVWGLLTVPDNGYGIGCCGYDVFAGGFVSNAPAASDLGGYGLCVGAGATLGVVGVAVEVCAGMNQSVLNAIAPNIPNVKPQNLSQLFNGWVAVNGSVTAGPSIPLTDHVRLTNTTPTLIRQYGSRVRSACGSHLLTDPRKHGVCNKLCVSG
jgi:hypothetical protein